MWMSVLLVVGSLLAVVVGDAMITDGQVRLTATQSQVAAAVTAQKAYQVAVAQLAAPPVVVAQAESQGLVAPTTVVDLPQVPLNVPLPVPQTAAPTAPANR
jgi:type II secretory pathway pseudopilin PulG